MDKLEDFVDTYPDQYDPDIQYLISKKQEFRELKGTTEEDTPEPGEKYKHQEYFLRLMKQYSRMFIFAEMGTGKSCTMIGLAEYYKNTGLYKKVYVLEKGPLTRADFKNQIVNRCTCDEYDVKPSDSKNTNPTRLVKNVYSVTTYGRFAEKAKNLRDIDIIEEYSNTIIFIDEAHNLRNTKKDPKKSKKTTRKPNKKERLVITEIYSLLDRIAHLAVGCKIVIASGTPNINDVGDFVPNINLLIPTERKLPPHSTKKLKHMTYDYRFVTLNQMEPFLRGILSYVRSLDTGIDVKDMGQKMDKKIEVEYVDIYKKLPALLEEKDGKFVKTPQNLENVVELIEIDASTVVYPIRMSKYQGDIFLGEYASINTGMMKQHASEFIFPDGSYGGSTLEKRNQKKAAEDEEKEPSGFSKYIKKTAKGYRATPELKAVLSNPQSLWKHSCKFYELIRIEEKNRDSNCFVYTESVTGSGAILLSLMFEEYDYEKFSGSESAFEKDGKTIKIPKRKRYAIISDDIKEKSIPNIMQLFNSDLNAHGEYIKVIIGSLLARDGINLYNVVRGYLFRAGWHSSGNEQALARFQRSTSHSALIKELNEQYPERKNRISIEIYRFCAYTYDGVPSDSKVTFKKKEFKQLFTGNFLCDPEDRKSQDIDLYLKSDLKDFYNKRMMRIWKCLAIDAISNKRRNMLQTDVDYTQSADYMKAKYDLWSDVDKANRRSRIGSKKVDYSTYDLYYVEKDITKLYDMISDHLVNYGHISYESMMSWVEQKFFRKKVLYYALEKILSEKTIINNRYGFPSYVHTDGNILFLQNDYPFYFEKSRHVVSYYSDIQIYSLSMSISETESKFLADIIQNPIVDNIMSLDYPDTEAKVQYINNLIGKLSVNFKAYLIEKVLNIYIKRDPVMQAYMERTNIEFTKDEERKDIVSYLIDKYKELIHLNVYEPEKDIEDIDKTLGNRMRSGKSIKPLTIVHLTPQPLHISHRNGVPYKEGETVIKDDVKYANLVYLHTIYCREKLNTGYVNSIKNKKVSGRIRILRPIEGRFEWRDLTMSETPVYSHIIDNFTKHHYELKIPAGMKDVLLLGYYLSEYNIKLRGFNHKFMVLQRNTKIVNEKKSSKERGRECIRILKPHLIKILIRENIENYDYRRTELPKDWKRDQYLEYLTNPDFKHRLDGEIPMIELKNPGLYPLSDLKRFYKWFASNQSVDMLCLTLADSLHQTERLLDKPSDIVLPSERPEQ